MAGRMAAEWETWETQKAAKSVARLAVQWTADLVAALAGRMAAASVGAKADKMAKRLVAK